jgi:hypothetical protein
MEEDLVYGRAVSCTDIVTPRYFGMIVKAAKSVLAIPAG